ncbi:MULTISPECIES: portal protein [unclassified Aminobacter]|uniref:portal protein n=1 Tax=unclassified Aminobacter TaxID=2644704 RepID=UPI0004675223|nr:MULTISPECIES: portal protein [unclassified Aminobacter]TWH35586.1 head-to-tail connecting protein [Aminobacter sp. J15]
MARVPQINSRDTETTDDEIAGLYARLEQDRQPFLDRARENSRYTIPSLFPPEGSDGSTRLYTPFQSIGAHGVNTLTSKLVMTLLPPNSPMFRLSVTDQVLEELQAKDMRAGVEKKLNEVERAVMDEIEGLSIRAALTEAIKYLIVGGNVLLYLPKKGGLKIFRLDRYVVQRDYEGNLLRVIIKETVARSVLPKRVLDLVEVKGEVDLPSDNERKVSDKPYDLYTVFERKDDRMVSYQTIKGVRIPGSEGSWKADRSPVMALRWTYLSDEDYGRSYIDEYFGDLSGAEALSKAIREAAAAAAKVVPMVNPTGLTRAADIARAQNLEVISGRKDDVTMLTLDKQGDLSVPHTLLNDIIQRLTHAFMMNKSVQRQGERVTAEEIRALVSDIDDVLGGIFSLLAQDLQMPLVVRIMDRMEREKKIPKLSSLKGPDGKPIASPKVVTGVEALGRGHDYNKYMTAARDIIIPFKQELQGEISIRDFAERALVSLSIDTDGLFLSEEQKAQNQQNLAAQQNAGLQQQMLMEAVKGGVGPVAKVAAEGISAQINQEDMNG